MSYFDGIKKGDKVYSLIYGEGIVTSVREEEDFAITVSLDSGGYDRFTIDGRFIGDSLIQDLYWQKPEINIIDKGKRLPDLPVDAKILVREEDSHEWLPRHFSNAEDGVVYCWMHGCTSFTCPNTVGWNQWKLPEDEE